jgi:hypothetical protein
MVTTVILPASTLRNLTSLQPVKINALRKSWALIGCCYIRKIPPAVHVIVRRFIPLMITMVTHALCLDAFWLVTCQVGTTCRSAPLTFDVPSNCIPTPDTLLRFKIPLIGLINLWDKESYFNEISTRERRGKDIYEASDWMLLQNSPCCIL